MQICKIWDSEYPWDVRVAKVCYSLTAAGHSVHLVSRNRKRLPTLDVLPEAIVHRLIPWPMAKLDEILQFPAFFNPRWIRRIFATARMTKSELILVRDLPLAPSAILVGRLLGIPVMLDMAENYPAMMTAIFTAGKPRFTDYFVRNPFLVNMLERWVLRHIDHVLVVVEESAERLVELGLSAEKITIVSNTPPISRIAANPRKIPKSGPLRLAYLGLLEAPRGLNVVLKAIHIAREQGLDVRLIIVGSGRERNALEEQARLLDLEAPIIEFLGHLPNDIALEIIANCDVGVVPHFANASWNSTIPNKLFDYMAAGLPVLCSDARPAARIINETGTGYSYDYDSASELADAIHRISDYDVRVQLALTGPVAIRSKYCWERDEERLLNAVMTLASRREGTR